MELTAAGRSAEGVLKTQRRQERREEGVGCHLGDRPHQAIASRPGASLSAFFAFFAVKQIETSIKDIIFNRRERKEHKESPDPLCDLRVSAFYLLLRGLNRPRLATALAGT
jgi:hypothetical protein